MSRKGLAIVGSVVLFIGAFLPVLAVPLMGQMTFFQAYRGLAILTTLLALATLAVALREKYRYLWLTGCGALAIVSFGLLQIIFLQQNPTAGQAAQNPFAGMDALIRQSYQIQYGWAVLLIGAVLIVGAAANLKLIAKPAPEVSGAAGERTADPRT